MLFLLLLPFLLNLFSLHPSTSSNWAQVSGPKLQNNAQCERTPWEARWGLFSAVLQKQRPAACLGQVTPTMNILSEEEIAAEKAKGQDAGTSADDQLIMIMYNSPSENTYKHFKMVNSR